MRKIAVVFILLCIAAPSWSAQIWSTRYQEKGRLLVEMRPLFEAMGASVTWDARARGIYAHWGDTEIRMYINDPVAWINDTAVMLDVPPRLVGSMTRVPLRFVGEAFMADVKYHGNVVEIFMPGSQVITVYIEDSKPRSSGSSTGIKGTWAFTSMYPVTFSELGGYSNWELTLMRNEIYARHGRPFNNAYVRNYFLNTGWYRPDNSFRESRLSKVESQNAATILDYQKRFFGKAAERP